MEDAKRMKPTKKRTKKTMKVKRRMKKKMTGRSQAPKKRAVVKISRPPEVGERLSLLISIIFVVVL